MATSSAAIPSVSESSWIVGSRPDSLSIFSRARRFLGRGVEMEDLFQIGSIGLLKAVDKFDPAFDVKFSTYAIPRNRLAAL